jgi:PST family polysaccharide transporter
MRLGVGVMSSVLLASGVLYMTRIIIIRKLGLAATGQYHAAYTLTAYYVGFILRAMSMDFFPRLSGLSNNHPAANRLLNDQIEIGLLLALPPLLGTLVLAPWLLRIFYTGEFVTAAAIVRWQVLGIFFGMMSWPLWHLQLAKGLGLLLLITETLFSLLQVICYWLCIDQWGLAGAGLAYFLAFVAHAAGMYLLCRKLSGFACSRRVLLISIPGLVLLLAAFAAQKLLPTIYGLGTGLVLCLAAAAGSFYGLQKVLGVSLKALLPRRFAANPFSAGKN